MKTPYDAALRALGREIDALRTAIGAAADRLVELEAERETLDRAIAEESALASREWTPSADGYLARARAERARLAEERGRAEARLEALRREAAESYGSLRALEEAAASFRAEALRQAEAAEQAGIDDFAGARVARRLRLARRPRDLLAAEAASQ